MAILVKGEKAKPCAASVGGEPLLRSYKQLNMRSDANHHNPAWRMLGLKESGGLS